MHLQHIELDRLRLSPVNMHHGRKAPDLSDLLPSVRTRGILQPLLVRPDDAENFEVVAGRRRLFCAQALAAEGAAVEPLPCAVLEPGDDAGALEASLLENLARLPPDEMSQYECFAKLVRDGKAPADIAPTFGITELTVKRRLALGNLCKPLREAYRREEIDGETIRHLTLASPTQQRAWLKLFRDPEVHAPHGWQVKAWLFGGHSISTKVALFPLDDYPGSIITDLFGEDALFVDTDLFWQHQNATIAAERDRLLAAGWTEVVVLETGQRFEAYQHEKTPKRKGGKVYIQVARSGEVEVHEGYLTRREAKRAQQAKAGKGNATAALPRAELTAPLRNYVDLHRHAAVRVALLEQPGVALRLLLAHALASSGHWQVSTEACRAENADTAASLAASPAQSAFSAARAEIAALLGDGEDQPAILHRHAGETATAELFGRLLGLSEADLLRVAAFVMGETLAVGSAVVEAAGVHLSLDTGRFWQADSGFYTLLRDRGVTNALLAEVAGQAVADANVAEKLKTQKQILQDCLSGSNGRAQVSGWLPAWLRFPAASYGAAGRGDEV